MKWIITLRRKGTRIQRSASNLWALVPIIFAKSKDSGRPPKTSADEHLTGAHRKFPPFCGTQHRLGTPPLEAVYDAHDVAECALAWETISSEATRR